MTKAEIVVNHLKNGKHEWCPKCRERSWFIDQEDTVIERYSCDHIRFCAACGCYVIRITLMPPTRAYVVGVGGTLEEAFDCAVGHLKVWTENENKPLS